MMKKVSIGIGLLCKILAVLTVLVFPLVSCNRKSSVKTMELTQPVLNISYDLGFDMETDCSNIVAETEYSSYQKDVERIRINIVNNNPGKAFYQ